MKLVKVESIKKNGFLIIKKFAGEVECMKANDLKAAIDYVNWELEPHIRDIWGEPKEPEDNHPSYQQATKDNLHAWSSFHNDEWSAVIIPLDSIVEIN